MAASIRRSSFAFAASVGEDARDPRPVERLADHAGRSHEDLARPAVDRLRDGVGDDLHRLDPLVAGEGVGVARVDDQRPRLAPLELLAAPVDRGRRALRPGEHAGDLGGLIEHRHHHVRAPLVAHARRDGGEADPGDRRQVGNFFGASGESAAGSAMSSVPDWLRDGAGLERPPRHESCSVLRLAARRSGRRGSGRRGGRRVGRDRLAVGVEDLDLGRGVQRRHLLALGLADRDLIIKASVQVAENPMARNQLLGILDMLWMNNLDDLESLSQSVGLRAYGQHDPLVEYRQEAHRLFRSFWANYNAWVFGNIFKLLNATTPVQQNQSKIQPATNAAPKSPEFNNVGRNDPCPCGAKYPDGTPKKYKHCGLENTAEHQQLMAQRSNPKHEVTGG